MIESQPPIIVRRVRKVNKGHGGAWKVAFADFATAMMAFFLVLWLGESTNEEQKQAISGYFTDPVGFVEGGSPNVIDLGGSVTVEIIDRLQEGSSKPADVVMEEDVVEDIASQIEQRKLAELMKQIVDKINGSEQLAAFKDQLIIDITEEGLRMQIVDKSQRPMFDSGEDELKPYFEDILYELASTIRSVPNKVSLSGHTDGAPYVGRDQYSNWELSTDRANAARRALVEGGLAEDQISRVVGLASSALYDEANPLNPVNRRISIIVLNKRAQQEIEGAEAAESLVSESELEAQLSKDIALNTDLIEPQVPENSAADPENQDTLETDIKNLLESLPSAEDNQLDW